MLNKFHWILPGHFRSKDQIEVTFDLTEVLNTFIKNEIWNRKIKYDQQVTFNADSLTKYKAIKITVFPYRDLQFRIQNEGGAIVSKILPNLPSEFQYIVDRGNLRTAKSLAQITIEYESDIELKKNCNREVEYDPEVMYFGTSEEFHMQYLELISLANEFASFLLFGMFMVFPTVDYGVELTQPQSSGLIVMENDSDRYIYDLHSSIMGHPVTLESDKTTLLMSTLNLIAEIWHKDLWSIHSVLKALRSDFIEIDNLLELVFTVESFFSKNTSADMMKTTICIMCCDDLKEAQDIDYVLTASFALRNEIVHGGQHYRIMDYYNIKGNKILIFKLFWSLKQVVIRMIAIAMSKLLEPSNLQQNKLSFTAADVYQKHFQKMKKA